MYRDILVHIDTDRAQARCQIAAEIAARGGGAVTGLYLKTRLIDQYSDVSALGFLPEADLAGLIKEYDEATSDDARKAAGILEVAAAAAGVRCESETVGGDSPEPLIARARLADLVVMPPPQAQPPYNVKASAVDVGLGCGGPVLVVPPKVDSVAIGRRVLLAWNGSREASRAMRDALPLLREGAVVEIRTAGRGDEEAGLGALRRHLERLGFVANASIAQDANRSIGEVLTHQAQAADCDLIVMGLYGHTRAREFVLGGASREMIHDPKLPLLVSH